MRLDAPLRGVPEPGTPHSMYLYDCRSDFNITMDIERTPSFGT